MDRSQNDTLVSSVSLNGLDQQFINCDANNWEQQSMSDSDHKQVILILNNEQNL